MKKIYSFLFFFSFHFTYSQVVNIPNSSFLEHLTNCNSVDSNGDGVYDSNADLNNDGQIQVSEAENVLYLDVSHTGTSGCGIGVISDLTGIEAFINLISFKCTGNSTFLTSINLTSNLALEVLDVSSNYLSSLDVSQNLNLRELNCSNNSISTIDVSTNLNLEKLVCSWNFNMSNLNTNSNLNLQELTCRGTPVSNLNISLNTNLVYLNCGSNNQLQELDLTNNLMLETLIFDNNTSIENIDISINTALKRVDCYATGITSLNLSNNLLLEELACSYNQISSLDVSNNISLNTLSANDTSLINIDLSNLGELFFADLSNNPNLTYVNVQNGINDYAYDNGWTLVGLYDVPNLEVICVDNVNSDFAYLLQSNHPDTIITDDCALSISEFNLSNVKVYPNPSIDYFKIENLGSLNIKTIELYNVTGKKLKKYSFSEIYEINDISSGIYFIKIKTERTETNRKIIKI